MACKWAPFCLDPPAAAGPAGQHYNQLVNTIIISVATGGGVKGQLPPPPNLTARSVRD